MKNDGTTLRIVVADDQRAVREALATVLDVEPGFQVVGLAADGDEAVELAHRFSPDVVLMDLRMPNVDGVTATQRLAVELPTVRVVVLTTFADDSSILTALEAGAMGFLTKDAGREQIALAVRSAAAGQSVLDPTVQASLLPRRVTGSSRRPVGPSDSRVAPRRPDAERGRRPAGDCRRADQRRDREGALHLRGHREEPHQPPVREDRLAQSSGGRQLRLRPRPRRTAVLSHWATSIGRMTVRIDCEISVTKSENRCDHSRNPVSPNAKSQRHHTRTLITSTRWSIRSSRRRSTNQRAASCCRSCSKAARRAAPAGPSAGLVCRSRRPDRVRCRRHD